MVVRILSAVDLTAPGQARWSEVTLTLSRADGLGKRPPPEALATQYRPGAQFSAAQGVSLRRGGASRIARTPSDLPTRLLGVFIISNRATTTTTANNNNYYYYEPTFVFPNTFSSILRNST